MRQDLNDRVLAHLEEVIAIRCDMLIKWYNELFPYGDDKILLADNHGESKDNLKSYVNRLVYEHIQDEFSHLYRNNDETDEFQNLDSMLAIISMAVYDSIIIYLEKKCARDGGWDKEKKVNFLIVEPVIDYCRDIIEDFFNRHTDVSTYYECKKKQQEKEEHCLR